MSLLVVLLACGRSAPPPEPLLADPLTVRMLPISTGGATTLLLTARSPGTLSRVEVGIWQDGVMIDTVTAEPALRLVPQNPARLDLAFEGLESGPVQLTGSLHLTGALGGEELMTVDLTGAVGEVTP